MGMHVVCVCVCVCACWSVTFFSCTHAAACHYCIQCECTAQPTLLSRLFFLLRLLFRVTWFFFFSSSHQQRNKRWCNSDPDVLSGLITGLLLALCVWNRRGGQRLLGVILSKCGPMFQLEQMHCGWHLSNAVAVGVWVGLPPSSYIQARLPLSQTARKLALQHNGYINTELEALSQASKQLPGIYTVNRHAVALSSQWCCVCLHLMNVSLIFTLLCALLRSPPTPEINIWLFSFSTCSYINFKLIFKLMQQQFILKVFLVQGR